MFYTNFSRYCEAINKSPYTVAAEIGVKSTATIAGWKAGAVPRPKVVDAIIKYFAANGLEIETADLFAEGTDDEETAVAVRDMLRNRTEAKILFNASQDAPASALLEAAALIMRYKEESKNR